MYDLGLLGQLSQQEGGRALNAGRCGGSRSPPVYTQALTQ